MKKKGYYFTWNTCCNVQNAENNKTTTRLRSLKQYYYEYLVECPNTVSVKPLVEKY